VVNQTIAAILATHRAGASPEETVARTYARIRAHDDPAIFISLRDEQDARAEAKALAEKGDTSLPLHGVPFAVKDNIDVGGMRTTAACPDFAYTPKADATCVARLRAAGAIPIGKTNLDQFATGLVGVRSPYGVPRNTFDRKLIPGGSSSGSAVAVAAGLVPFALGTDTAGSGRVPAGLNNIVGLKPSLGVVSTAGAVPACRTLDCVSVFALTVDDAWAAFTAMAGPDIADPYTRDRPPGALGPVPPGLRIGVPIKDERVFFGDHVSAAQFEAAIARFERLGATIVEIDIEPFYETARLLYEGPWVAERYLAARKLIASSPGSMYPVTRDIILGGARSSAIDAFAAFYKLEDLRGVRDHTFRQIDVLLVPTMPTVYTVEQVLADPIQLNSRLGTYTNFVNLLDLCGLAVPRACAPTASRSASRCSGSRVTTPRSPRSGACFTPTRNCRWARRSRVSRHSRRCRRCRPRARSRSRSSARISPTCRSTANSSGSARASWRARRPRRTIACSRLPAPIRRGRAFCASRPARALRLQSRSGRCRPTGSAVSSPRSRRPCRSARSRSPTAAP
jgi:allophanate hydrolase